MSDNDITDVVEIAKKYGKDIEIDNIDLTNFGPNELLVVRMEPPIPKEFVNWLEDTRKEYFPNVVVMIIPPDISITRVNIDNLVEYTSKGSNDDEE